MTNDVCIVGICINKRHRAGLCLRHWTAKQKTGSPKSADESIKSYVLRMKKGDGVINCWKWKGSTKNGYGIGSHQETKETLAHRISYVAYHGAIPSGLSICHRCDNPKCVNPAHLFAGDTHANVEDAVLKGRMKWGKNKNKTATLYKRRVKL